MQIKEKLKSWALWLSLAGLIAFLIKTFAHIDITPWLDELLDYLLPVLIGFGIVNNPDVRNHF